MVDAGGLNPPGPEGPCGFESRPGYLGVSDIADLAMPSKSHVLEVNYGTRVRLS